VISCRITTPVPLTRLADSSTSYGPAIARNVGGEC
jgi:hypothetical protein